MLLTKLTFFNFLLATTNLAAQLMIMPGAQVTVSGEQRLTLHNFSIVNDGAFISGNGRVTFSGSTPSFIDGTNTILFNELAINKPGNTTLLLRNHIRVSQRLLFTLGLLDLNGFDVDLGTTGSLEGETENTRIIGAAGGEVLFNADLNTPADSNPGNLGLFISSSKFLGNCTIRRGHRAETSGGLRESINRYFTVTPINNTALNATLRFNYFQAELNRFAENELVLFAKQGAADYASLGFTSRNLNGHFLEKTGIESLGRFTLSTIEPSLSGEQFRVWPNPVRDILSVNIITRASSAAELRLFDSKSSLVKVQQLILAPGGNNVTIDMQPYASGVYHLSLTWNNGGSRKTIQVLKE